MANNGLTLRDMCHNRYIFLASKRSEEKLLSTFLGHLVKNHHEQKSSKNCKQLFLWYNDYTLYKIWLHITQDIMTIDYTLQKQFPWQWTGLSHLLTILMKSAAKPHLDRYRIGRVGCLWQRILFIVQFLGREFLSIHLGTSNALKKCLYVFVYNILSIYIRF